MFEKDGESMSRFPEIQNGQRNESIGSLADYRCKALIDQWSRDRSHLKSR